MQGWTRARLGKIQVKKADNRADMLTNDLFLTGFICFVIAREASTVAAAWNRGDREAATRAVTDDMIEATSVAGTAAQCREKIEAYRESGIDLPIINPFARGPESKAVFETLIRSCAPD